MAHTLDDYTIAWICALPLEAAAARAMLDKIHNLPERARDPNAYEFGELNGHHIVIAHLPNGIYGTVSAAAVVSRMRLTFPRLQFGLMVGIGGGVPSKNNDIRLGDVVVSTPGGRHGGVIQYDYGKAVQDGQFELTGMLNQPPQALLTHISQIRAKQMTAGGDVLSFIISQAQERNPSIEKELSCPVPEADPALENFLPQSEQGQILITTRNRKLASKLAPFNIIQIPNEDRTTAFQIMQRLLTQEVLVQHNTTAASLLEQLAFLPLAITQASAYIIENGIQLSDYLALLQEQERDAVELLSEDFSDLGRYKDIQNPVLKTWADGMKLRSYKCK
ncbi:hypothetical protein CBS76997_9978 [Aspergillus niger]|nr:hypothetical protein CBS13152_8364 [Aspergillus niger]KAI2962712.1 hypothetical protein CBS147323_7160 [Aspergillus niger]KAI3016420.1 hypothetical protein CBS147347_10737 [Aspergillus niger]KAI3036437.1 hypothetical protein CBS76997_9978 [Aspergillus niger]